MAFMIPQDVEEFKTEGEKHFYAFLEFNAKPDATYLAWYTPDINDREPDFILYGKKTGLVIFEVKDWTLDQIEKADPSTFVIKISSETESRKNPLKQAKEYLYQVMDKIKDDQVLTSKDPLHHGNPSIPMTCGVIFTNINKFEYQDKGLHNVISTDRIFFWDDLHPSSDICSDTTGKCFSDTLKEKFMPKFDFNLSGSELNHLKQLIFPSIRLDLPKRESNDTYKKRICRLKGLDHHQETLARKFDGGHRTIVGPSGCGKTLILVHKAAFLKQYNRKIKKILFVCYNITLVNYIKRLLANKNVPMGENGVMVKHLFELCSDILGETVAYENESQDYYDVIVEESLTRVKDYEKKYDAILVDEGQDMNDNMYKIMTSLLNTQTNNLTIALDDNQNIYERQSSWKEVGVHAKGRVHKISYIYRNTKEITTFTEKFKGRSNTTGNDNGQTQLKLFPDYFNFSGPNPIIHQFPDMESIVQFIPKKISDVVTNEGCPYSEIAVLYITKYPNHESHVPLPTMLEEAMASKGIPCSWTAENVSAKRHYDITTNSVSISTIHSAKGFDYACVFLLGLDLLEPKAWSEEQTHKLVYVAITRARYQLIIPYVHENDIILRLKESM